MAHLILGPCLRYVGESEATVWVETSAPCEVEVLGSRAATFTVEGHHYALVVVEGLEPGSSHAYEVSVDGRPAWPEPSSRFPPSVLHTIDRRRPFTLLFGSCRDAAPHHPPWTGSRSQDRRGRGIDALYAYALRMMERPAEEWPDTLLLLGDQVYADDPSPGTAAYIRAKRDIRRPPGKAVADFDEYTQLYREAWSDPPMRWLLSTVPTAMIFDDHDVHDDWNTSSAWIRRMRAAPWWRERIVGALMAYWLYQHLGNLSPRELAADGLLERLHAADDPSRVLRAFAEDADASSESTRWSYHRDLGATRLVVVDSRCGRVLDEGRREMLDEHEWRWLEEQVSGSFDHLLLASSLPFLLARGTHFLEAWNEAVCDGAWGRRAARLGEWIRQAADLEHWAAFARSFDRLAALVGDVAAGRRGDPPASVVALSGDVHHAYLADTRFPAAAGVRSAVYQAVCSPVRNPVGPLVRRMHAFAATRVAEWLLRALARTAGARDPAIDWRLTRGPWFDNQVASLELDGRSALLRIERVVPMTGRPQLQTALAQPLGAG